MPQMLTSQNKPERDSQEHLNGASCQAGSLSVSSLAACHVSAHGLTHIPVSVSPCIWSCVNVTSLGLMCTHVLCASVILDVFVNSSGGNVRPRRGQQQLMSLLSSDIWTDCRQKLLRDQEVSPWLIHWRLPGAWQVHSHVLKRKKERRVQTHRNEWIHW